MTIMRWFRTRSRWGSRLALVALALQLVLSFGHIHLKDVLGEPHSSASAVASTLALVSDEQPSAQGTNGSHHEHEDEYCAIYAINGLIGSAQHAEPPALLMPLRIGRALQTLGYEIPLAELHHTLFQARAPPVA